MRPEVAQLLESRRTRMERVRDVHNERRVMRELGIKTPCPFELVKGADSPERTENRHRYWRAVNIIKNMEMWGKTIIEPS